MRIQAISLIAAALLAGCVPAMTRRSPAVTGTLALDGRPVEGAVVFANWNANAACKESKVRSTTDKQGAFALPVGRAFEWYPLVIFGDYGYGWRLCFEYNGQQHEGYYDMGWGTPPKNFRVECDLSNKAITDDGNGRGRFACKRLEPET